MGDEPFVVILGDDIMVDDGELLRSMIDVYEREHASVLALLEVEPNEISSYGCAECDVVDDTLRRVRSVVEKPRAEDAQSNLAVIGRYVFSPGIFDALGRITPGVGGELQLTDAIGLLLDSEPVFGRVFARSLRHRSQARLPPRQHRARARPRRPRAGARGLPARAGAGPAVVIPLADVQQAVIDRIVRFDPVECDRADALGLVLAADVVAAGAVPPFANTAMDGYAVGAADTAGASDAAPVRLRVVGDLPAGHAPTVAVGQGEAIRIMTGAPMPDGADAIVIVELTQRVVDDADGDAVDVLQEAAPGAHVRRPGGDVEAGQLVFRAGTVLGPAHLGVLASIDVHKVSVFPVRTASA